MGVVARRDHLQHDGSDVFRRGLSKVLRVGAQHLGNIGNGGGGDRNRFGPATGNQDVDVVAELLRRGDRVKRRGFESRVIVLGNDQYRHGWLSDLSIDG